MNLRRLLPSPALTVSVTALIVAMGGTSYAAGLIGSGDIRNNSVRSGDIRDNTLRSGDIRNNTVRSGDIRDNTLRSGDIRNDTLRSGDIRDGSVSRQDLRPSVGASRWVLINAAGEIESQSGGFEVEAAYPVLENTALPGAPDNSLRANGNVYIDAHENLTNNGIVSTIALQNAVDQDGDGNMNGRGGNNFEFSGEISNSICGLPGTTCAPPGTNTTDYFVVSPRNSDGSVTSGTARKRFYIIITGNSSDRTN